jgi:peptidylprolyl isomerase
LTQLTKVVPLRKLIAIFTSLLLLPVLTACLAEVKPFCDPYTTGTALDDLKVSGSYGAKPVVDFSQALSSQAIETKVISEGSGPVIVGKQFVKFDYTVLNGTTKAKLGESSYDSTGGEAQFLTVGNPVDICHGLSGVTEGSRVAMLIPAGVAAPEDTDTIKKTDSVLFVLDITKVYLQGTSTEAKPANNGMPSVVFAPDGTPGVTMPKASAPTEFKSQFFLDGSGEKVTLGDTVTLNYSGFLWESGSLFDSSWANGQPQQFQVTEGGLISGFVKALVGSKVGSKMVVVIPPELGYGEQGNDTIPGNATLVFVIEVLGIDKPVK